MPPGVLTIMLIHFYSQHTLIILYLRILLFAVVVGTRKEIRLIYLPQCKIKYSSSDYVNRVVCLLVLSRDLCVLDRASHLLAECALYVYTSKVGKLPSGRCFLLSTYVHVDQSEFLSKLLLFSSLLCSFISLSLSLLPMPAAHSINLI